MLKIDQLRFQHNAVRCCHAAYMKKSSDNTKNQMTATRRVTDVVQVSLCIHALYVRRKLGQTGTGCSNCSSSKQQQVKSGGSLLKSGLPDYWCATAGPQADHCEAIGGLLLDTFWTTCVLALFCLHGGTCCLHDDTQSRWGFESHPRVWTAQLNTTVNWLVVTVNRSSPWCSPDAVGPTAEPLPSGGVNKQGWRGSNSSFGGCHVLTQREL